MGIVMSKAEFIKKLDQISKLVFETLPRHLQSLRGSIEQLSQEVKTNGKSLAELVQQRDGYNGEADQNLRRYQERQQAFLFEQADSYLERSGELKRRAYKLSREIGMFKKRTREYRKHIEDLGTDASDLSKYTERLIHEAEKLHTESLRLAERIGPIESDIKAMGTSAKEES